MLEQKGISSPYIKKTIEIPNLSTSNNSQLDSKVSMFTRPLFGQASRGVPRGQTCPLLSCIKKNDKATKELPPAPNNNDNDSNDSSNTSSLDPSFSYLEKVIGEEHNLPEFSEAYSEHFELIATLLAKHPSYQFINKLKVISQKISRSSECFLGKVIYLIDKDPDYFFSTVLSEENVIPLTKLVNRRFTKLTDEIKTHVMKLRNLHEQSGIQSPELFLQTHLPYVVAEILVTNDGTINTALIPCLKKPLLSSNSIMNSYQKDMYRVLKLIRKKSSIKEKLEKIKKPESVYSTVNNLIRIQIEKTISDTIDDRDAIVTALTSILSHLRQGPTGTCFSTHLGIVLLSSHIGQCLEDFQILLEKSKLTRWVNNTEKDFPFLLRMGNYKENYSFTISSNGEILNSAPPFYLWEAPGILSACRSIQIEDPKTVISTLLQELSKQDSPIELTIQSLLSLLADHQVIVKKIKAHEKMRLFSLANFAFESQTRNGLLSVWENSIAEMAEGKEEGMIIPPLLNAISSPILEFLNTKLPVNYLSKQELLDLSCLIEDALLKRIHLHYDPHIFNHTIDNTHQSSEGGFILYDTKNTRLPHHWKRIDSTEKFTSFTATLWDHVKEPFAVKLAQKIDENEINKILEQITTYIASDQYLFDAMVTYYPQYRTVQDLIINWKECRYTPWRTLSGNLADKVREVYREDQVPIQKRRLQARNATKLLCNLLKMVKKLSNEERAVYKANPYKKIPVFTSTHAFSLMLGNPKLLNYRKNKLKPLDWIKQSIIFPGEKIISTPVNEEITKKLIQFSAKHLIASEKHQTYLQAADNFTNKQTVPELRNKLIKLAEILDESYLKNEDRKEILDHFICSILPDSIQEALCRSAIPIADTNWQEGLHDIYLCIVVNPCSGNVEIMAIDDQATKLKPVKQHWLFNQDWEYYNDLQLALPEDDYP